MRVSLVSHQKFLSKTLTYSTTSISEENQSRHKAQNTNPTGKIKKKTTIATIDSEKNLSVQ